MLNQYLLGIRLYFQETIGGTKVPVPTEIEAVDKVVCHTEQQNKRPLLVNIMEDTDATTMCIAICKGAIWLYTNWNANYYFIDMWCAEFSDGARRYSP